MAGSLNKVMLIGNLGVDPEVRTFEGGTTLVKFTIATTESYKKRDTGEKVENTEWHNITMWRGLAEVAEKYLKKGDKVYIEGKLKTTSYEKEGQTKYFTEIVADQMQMLTPKGQSGTYNSGAGSSQPNTASEPSNVDLAKDDSEDDLPF